MTDIEKLFRPESDVFTVFVVEQRFVVGRGYEFFHSYINTSNFLDSDEKIGERFRKTINIIERGVAPVSKLISFFATSSYIASISEMITSLCKLFTVNEHQAAGPDVIDPIILQEGKVSNKAITKLVHINKESILRPSIIVMLKDNDFKRAKSLLSECPDGINVKMIRNSGEEELYKVVNCGSSNITSFISSFAEQCYSTCSNTNRNILLNTHWAENEIVSKFCPVLLRYRTNLMFDQKEEIRSGLSDLIYMLSTYECERAEDKELLDSIECVAKLFRVFCNDYGGRDILDAESIARRVNNELLLAHVFRYAELLPNCPEEDKLAFHKEGYNIFKRNGMNDNAIYCLNNMLIQQFYTDHVSPEQFRDMQIEAVSNVPGLVGLSHIYNNVGIAYLYCGNALMAIDFFNKGLEYAKYQDRIVQNLALESNKMIAESYSYSKIDQNRILFLLRKLFDGMGFSKLPFLAADFALNIISVSYRQKASFGLSLVKEFPIEQLIKLAFQTNKMGAAERILQLQYLASHYHDSFPILNNYQYPVIIHAASGKRKEFIEKYGYSPFDFNTWL